MYPEKFFLSNSLGSVLIDNTEKMSVMIRGANRFISKYNKEFQSCIIQKQLTNFIKLVGNKQSSNL